MKSAIIHVTAIQIQCPECEEFQTNRLGSYMFTDEDRAVLEPKVMACQSCGKRFRLPSTAHKI